MIINNFNSILELLETFSDEQKCINHLEKLRWNNNVVSPYDSTSKVYKIKDNKYKCKNTDKHFNVKTGTLFQNTKISLQKWFVAIYLVLGHKKGISSIQLSKDIGVTQKTAWFMLQRIRNCLQIEESEELMLSNEVEVDETYIGGKNKNRHPDKKVKNCQGRSAKDKVPVMGMIERKGRLIAQQIDNTKAKTLVPLICKYVKKDSSVYTDEWSAYVSLKDNEYNHSIVRHNIGQYVNGKVYTNTVEGFWSLLKRGLTGVYHFASKKHLQKYIDEFVFRYNERNVSNEVKFNLLLSNNHYKLTYRELTN